MKRLRRSIPQPNLYFIHRSNRGSVGYHFLNDAAYLAEDFLKAATNPPYDGNVKYGDRTEYCWNGGPTLHNYLSRLHYNTQYLPEILDRIEKTAPAGADLKGGGNNPEIGRRCRSTSVVERKQNASSERLEKT